MSTRKKIQPTVVAAYVEQPSLINKYRPRIWEDVLGQETAVLAVESAMAVNSHAYLFHGGAGTGKTSMARILAETLSASLQEVDAATHSGVDAMRELVAAQVYQSLAGSGRRAVLVDECHRLSKEAWDALLKPLEEPESHVYYMLCSTNPSKIPPTIRSRLASIELQPVHRHTLFELLNFVADEEKFHISDIGLKIIAAAAEGSPRLALALLSTCHQADTDDQVRLLCRDAGENAQIIDLARMLVARNATWPAVMKILVELDEPAESIRLMITNYTAKVLLGTTDAKKAVALLAILDAFREPCSPVEKMAPILRAFGYLLIPN